MAGKTFSTGSSTDAIWQDSSNNIGIGGAASSSHKFQVTGATNLTGVLTLGSTISNGTYTYTLPSATGTLALASQIPSLAGYVPTSRVLTINGVSYNLTADASWTVSAGTTLNGTGFVKASGTTISYDNSTYYLASNPNGYITSSGTAASANALSGINSAINAVVQSATISSIIGQDTNGSLYRFNLAALQGFGVITSSNIGSQSVNYATSSGSTTSASYLTGGDSAAYMLLYNSLGGNLNDYNTPGLYSAEYTGSSNKPSGFSNGHFIQISDAGGTDVKTQLYYNDAGDKIAMRLMWGNGTWRSWRTLITDSNIGSQSVSYASSAGSVSWSNVSSKPSTLGGYGISDAVMAYYGTNVNPNTQTGDYITMTTQSGISGWTHVINMAWTTSQDNWVSQIAFGAQNGDGAYYRTTSGAISSVAWKRLLDSSNYSSYAVPTSGGTMTGKLTVYNSSLDSHFLAAGGAPSYRLADSTSGPSYQGLLGMTTYYGQFVSACNPGDTVVLGITSGGRVFITSGANGAYMSYNATSFTSNSDIRLKNITGTIDNAMDKIRSLRTIKYTWKTDSTK